MALRDNYLLLKKFRKELQQDHVISGATSDLYEHYESLMLDWAGETQLCKAPSFKFSFPDYMNTRMNAKGEPYSIEYKKGAIGFARRFFSWARDSQKDFRSMDGRWIKSIKPSKDIGTLPDVQYYTLEDVLKLCSVQPTTMRMRRMIAAIAFLLLSGMRISAFLTLPIRNVNISAMTIKQDPRDGVATKNNKAAVTTLLNISKLVQIVKEWDAFVRASCPEDSSWYARLDQDGKLDPRHVEPMTNENIDYVKKQARNPRSQFYKDLKELCELAGVEYKSPHKARHGHIHLGMAKAKTFEDQKAVSMNVMHSTVTITDAVYSRMKASDSNEIIAGFDFDDGNVNEDTGKLPAGSSGNFNFDPTKLKAMDPNTLRTLGEFLSSFSTSEI